MSIIVGPWDLDHWHTGEPFDIHGFIEKAEAGKYDENFLKYGMDRTFPWYIQLKQDVENGLYDKGGPDEKERYETSFARFKKINDHIQDENLLKSLFGGNMWIDAAHFISGREIPYSIHENYINATMMTFRDNPEEGWRK